MNEKKKENSIGKDIYLFIFLFILLLAGLSTLSFAFYRQYNISGGGSINSNNTITTGDIVFAYSDVQGGAGAVPSNGIQITNATPLSDELGKIMLTERSYFDFQIIASRSGSQALAYQVILEKLTNSTLADSDIKVYVTTVQGAEEIPVEETMNLGAVKVYSQFEEVKENAFTGKLLFQRTVNEQNYQHSYRLRMWLRRNAKEYYNKNFSVKVNVKAFMNGSN